MKKLLLVFFVAILGLNAFAQKNSDGKLVPPGTTIQFLGIPTGGTVAYGYIEFSREQEYLTFRPQAGQIEIYYLAFLNNYQWVTVDHLNLIVYVHYSWGYKFTHVYLNDIPWGVTYYVTLPQPNRVWYTIGADPMPTDPPKD